MYNYVTQPQEYQAFTMFDEHTPHDDDDSLYPIPKGSSWHLFFLFHQECVCVFFIQIIQNMWFLKVRGYCLRRSNLQKNVRTCFKKVETHKTPLEQSSLILSIYFSSWPLEYSFQQTHMLYIYRYMRSLGIKEILSAVSESVCKQI